MTDLRTVLAELKRIPSHDSVCSVPDWQLEAVLDHVAALEAEKIRSEHWAGYAELERRLAEAEKVAAVARERFGPAGYKIIVEAAGLRDRLAETIAERNEHHVARNKLEVEQHELRCKVAVLEAENAELKRYLKQISELKGFQCRSMVNRDNGESCPICIADTALEAHP